LELDGKNPKEFDFIYYVENEAQTLIFHEYNEDFPGWYTG